MDSEYGLPEITSKKIQAPKIVVINTTIVGMKYKSGIMIATDARATIGNQVSNLYRLRDNIYIGATGVGQDTCTFVNLLRSQLELHQMNNDFRRVPVRCANLLAKKIFHSQCGILNVNVLIAGVDHFGTEIYSSRFDGSSDTVPFTAIGSGMLTALAMLETRWCGNLGEQAARDALYEAVVIGTGQDVRCGGPVRLCIMRSDFSVEEETLGFIAPPPKPSIPRIVPVIVHESVEKVEDDRTRKSWIAEYLPRREGGEGEGGEEEREEGERVEEEQGRGERGDGEGGEGGGAEVSYIN